MLRIALADSQPIVRQGLISVLISTTDMEVVAEAENSDALIRHLNSEAKIDLLLLDINFTGISGIGLIERIKACRKTLPILVFSMQQDSQMIVRAIKAGIAGYISKDAHLDVLLGAIRRVGGGRKYIDPILAEQMAFEDAASASPSLPAILSNRELEVFRLLIAGMRVNEIAGQLFISNKTVSSHKKKIMEKMHFSSMAELMRYAVQRHLFDLHEVQDTLGDITPLERAVSVAGRRPKADVAEFGMDAGNDSDRRLL